jgi:glycosidase
VNVIGNVPDADTARVAFFQGGRVHFDAIDSGIALLLDLPLHYALRRTLAEGQSLRQLPEQLARDHLHPDPEALVTFLGSAEVCRFLGEKGATVAGLQSAFTFLFTTRGIPLIYYGDEIAMRGGNDPDNRRDFPGGWLEDPRNAFATAGRTPDQQAVFEHVAALSRLRRQCEALRRGRLLHLLADDRAYVYARLSRQQRMVVALNNSRQPQLVTVKLAPLGSTTRAHLQPRLGGGNPEQIRGDEVTLSLPALSALVWEVVETPTASPSPAPAQSPKPAAGTRAPNAPPGIRSETSR